MDNIRNDGNRVLRIQDYRNIGVTMDGKERPEVLKINRSLRREAIGGLVTLIGPNNSGKTNILDALESCNKYVTDRDYTDFSFKPAIPRLDMQYLLSEGPKMCARRVYKGTPADVMICLMLEQNAFESMYEVVQLIENPKRDEMLNTYFSIVRQINSIIQIIGYQGEQADAYVKFRNDFIKPASNALLTSCLSRCNTTDPNLVDSLRKSLENVNLNPLVEADEIAIGSNGIPFPDDVLYSRMDESLQGTYYRTVQTHYIPENIVSEDYLNEKLGYELGHGIIRYLPVKFDRADMSCQPTDLNMLLESILSACGFDVEAVARAYADDGLILGSLERRVISELKRISSQFNDLVGTVLGGGFELEMKFESQKIQLRLYRGKDVPLDINKQPEGFRWLFGFFVEVILKKDLQPGDMILVDEFGNSLNWRTVIELRDMLRTIGKEKGVTFVLATQNPMAVDMRHLDEVRLIIPNEDGTVNIRNEFTVFSEGDPNVMRPILESLTISRNTLRNDDARTVFVEGVTDYFYLTAFERLLNNDGERLDIDFIPINGVGIDWKDAKARIENLKAIERYFAVIVDGDDAGERFRKTGEKKGIQVISLSEIFDGKKKVIEDLFSEEELNRFNLNKSKGDTGKHLFDRAAVFSQGIVGLGDDISNETKENFRRVFDYVLSELP